MTRKSAVLLFAILLALPGTVFAQGGGAGIMGWLRDSMSMEIGSVTIDGTGYSKVVLAPEVRMGRLKMGLYFPVIYQDDLFSPSTWYAPGGNNEWDFGGSKWNSDVPAALLDLTSDLILKIRYIEYGQQLEDKFFVKVGNLKGLTIGHGLIMRDYRNDTEFPAIRRTGVNLGYDFGPAGFEALVNDLPVPDLYGARFYVRPIKGFKLAVGLSGVVDTNPTAELPAEWAAASGNVMFMGSGLYLDLPIIPSNAVFGIRAFADAAVTVPYVKDSFTSWNAGTPTVEAGLRTDLLWDGSLHNWGAATGFTGNVLFIDWRLEYRYFTGIFRPSFFDSTYDRMRAGYVNDYVGYLDGSTAISTAPAVMGVYGEAAFNLFKEKLVLAAGYMWPWSLDPGFDPLVDADDEFHARLIVKNGLIPVVNVSGAITYDKRRLVGSITDGSFKFFDADSVFGGEIVMPVPGSPNLLLAALFQTVPARDGDGNVIYTASGVPEIQPSITIETRFSF